MADTRLEARAYTRKTGEDSPEVCDFVRPDVGDTATERGGPAASADTGGDNE